MKNVLKPIAVIALGALTLVSCKKNEVTPVASSPSAQPTVASMGNENARMWATGKQLYAVGHNSTNQAFLYTLAPPGIGGLNPTLVSGFFVGGTQVTNVTGLAYTTGSFVISTSASSNFPSRLLTYNAIGPYTAPTSVACQGITDIEYNEYDSKLYGILANSQIVKIGISGAITVIASPALGGNQIKGLCNYSGLLSYSISDNTTAVDNFYSCTTGGISTFLFSTDWGLGNGGMQYCDAYGWGIVTSTSFKKTVTAIGYIVTSPTALVGGPYLISDMTSN
jgi:hypothetical protein